MLKLLQQLRMKRRHYTALYGGRGRCVLKAARWTGEILRSSAVDMEEVGATLGETQRFECQVIGFPTPTIRWFKDEVDITDSERYRVDYERELGVITLVIRNVTLGDEGLYQCRAENSEGYATTTAYLVVKGHRRRRLRLWVWSTLANSKG